MQSGRPVVVGHRGASGYRPEHTLAAYELAARLGADAVEPDVVPTRDGVLVARHESELSGSTDIASRPDLADRRTTKTVEGQEVTGWFTEDLTLAEVRSLRAVEPRPHLRQRCTIFDGRYGVPTLAEVLDLSLRLTEELGRTIGVHVETKHPAHFSALGLGLEELLVRDLRGAGLSEARTHKAGVPDCVMSFEPSHLLRLAVEHGLDMPLLLLASSWDDVPPDRASTADGRTYRELLAPAGLRKLAAYLAGIGPDKRMVVPWTDGGRLGEPTSLVADAHAAGLLVRPWTFRAENAFLPTALRSSADPAAFGRVVEEMTAHLRAGVDGLITDHPDLAVLAREDAAR